MSNNIKLWIKAFRLRTLPLALASIGLGSFIAASNNVFNLRVTILALLTTLFLQILSNLANDYGDFIHGADSKERLGPSRLVQSGSISPKSMKTAIGIFAILSAITGFLLIYKENLMIFLPLGLLAIIAAITYTAGIKPYGYAGFGDISVFLFFGLVGVLGTYYLHAHELTFSLILPACTCGLFSTAVLNINNIRDINSDELAGKKSIPVRIGEQKAKIYHWILLISGLLTSILYTFIEYKSIWQLLFLIIIPLIIKNGIGIWNGKLPSEIDPYLKQMAITTLIFVLTFGIGNNL